jgi:hypothetical protein
MGAFDSIFRISLAAGTFQLKDYRHRAEPIVKDNARTGTKHTIEGEGWVEAADWASFVTGLGATTSAFRRSGLDVEIFGPGGVSIVKLTKASSTDGGPHCGFEVANFLDGEGAGLARTFRFTITSNASDTDAGGDAEDSYKTDTETRPDGLTTVTRKGTVSGAGASGIFEDGALADMQDVYAWPDWVVNYQTEVDPDDTLLTYEIKAVQMAEPLPGDEHAVQAIEGAMSDRSERDEQMRLTRTIQHDYLVVGGDPQTLRAELYDALPQDTEGNPPVVLRESWEVSGVREVRLKASFTILSGGDGNALMDWEQSWEVERPADVIQAVTYPEGKPQLIYTPQAGFAYVQRGRAVGAGQYPVEPDPILPALLSSRPKVVFDEKNAVEKETAWEYHFLSDVELDAEPDLTRPVAPQFYE